MKSEYSIIDKSKNLVPPYLVKKINGSTVGLSSGAGSTLIRYKNKTFKIKRNGYRYSGFLENKILDRGFSIKKKRLFEKTDYEVGGAMSIDDAEREISTEIALRKGGILVPQRTVALYKIKMPFKKEDAVAIIQEVDSDLRADELCMVVLTNLFYDTYGKDCGIDIVESSFRYKNYSVSNGLSILNRKYRNFLDNLAKNIGKIYRDFHDLGYLRGISNSWYGNEIICKDGNIGVCDLEACFSRKDVGDKQVFDELCKTDVNLALVAFYDSMNFFENSLASFVGSILIDGFKKGYETKSYKPLDIDKLHYYLNRFMQIRDRLVKNG